MFSKLSIWCLQIKVTSCWGDTIKCRVVIFVAEASATTVVQETTFFFDYWRNAKVQYSQPFRNLNVQIFWLPKFHIRVSSLVAFYWPVSSPLLQVLLMTAEPVIYNKGLVVHFNSKRSRDVSSCCRLFYQIRTIFCPTVPLYLFWNPCYLLL